MRILIIGLTTLDLHIRHGKLPELDDHAYLKDYQLSPGGSAANMAFSLACLGAEASLSTRLGNDFAGQIVRQHLARNGVVLIGDGQPSAQPTGFSVINVGDDGRIALLHCEGANDLLCSQDLRSADIERNDIVHIGGAMSLRALDGEPLVRLCELAKSHGKLISLHTSRNTDKRESLFRVLPYLDFMFMNEKEAIEITGMLDVEAAARWFHSQGVRTVAVTLGSRGAYASTGDLAEFVPAPIVSVVDTTGCGDAFTAGFLDAAWRRKNLVLCAAWGNALGAHCTQTLGAMPGPFTRSDVERWLVT